MLVKRIVPEVIVPEATVDITGLTLRQAGALRALIGGGITWHLQDPDLRDFFRDLVHQLDVMNVDPVLLRIPGGACARS